MPLDSAGWPDPWLPLGPDRLARVLDHAAELIEQRGWCKGSLARHWLGWGCSPYALFARRYCARGALQRAIWCDGGVSKLHELDAAEIMAARTMALAAAGSPLGTRFLWTLQYEEGMTDKAPGSPPAELAAIERWNDASKDGGREVAALLRITARWVQINSRPLKSW